MARDELDRWEHPTLTHTRKLVAAPLKSVLEGHPLVRPAPKPFPGRPIPPLPAQLSLFEEDERAVS